MNTLPSAAAVPPAPQRAAIRDLLEHRIPYAAANVHSFPGNAALKSYGLGRSSSWSMQAHTTATGAFALLAVDADTRTSVTGVSRDELLATALAMVRFWIQTHRSGDQTCTDNQPWGHTWITALCTERVMHAVAALDPYLSDADRAGVARLHASEADWLLEHYPVTCGLRTDNHPESNIWNGAIMHRAALLNPDHDRKAAWQEQALTFLVNGISTPTDAAMEVVLDGKPIRERHVGPNCTADFEMFHHNYLNIGYMVICLSNIALAHFWLKRAGHSVPAALYHHAAEIWRLVKFCTFPDGRLCRIGGDTRVRYTYCQDYALPAWHWAADYLGDTDVIAFQDGWLKQMQIDRNAATDGSFMGGRLASLAEASPLYRLRLEGDRAATLSMAACWDAIPAVPGAVPEMAPANAMSVWHGRESGSVMLRGKRRLASFVWNGGEGPTGLLQPSRASDWAEWSCNLAGRVEGMGALRTYSWEVAASRVGEGSFFTRGSYTVSDANFVAEGDSDRVTARIEIAVTALPDDATMVVAQRATALNREWFRTVKGLFLQLPNDIFNANRRILHTRDGPNELAAGELATREVMPVGRWINIEGQLSVVALCGGPLSLYRPAQRNVAIYNYPPFARVLGKGHLRCEEVCQGCCMDSVTLFETGAILFDIVTVLRVGDTPAQTSRLAQALQASDPVKLKSGAWDGSLTEVSLQTLNRQTRQSDSVATTV